MILAVSFVALGVVVTLSILAVRRLGRVVEAEEAEEVLRSEYDAFDSGEKS